LYRLRQRPGCPVMQGGHHTGCFIGLSFYKLICKKPEGLLILSENDNLRPWRSGNPAWSV
jgi:hypothetical protein